MFNFKDMTIGKKVGFGFGILRCIGIFHDVFIIDLFTIIQINLII